MKLKKYRQIDVAFLIVCISYIVDIGNAKYALAGIFAVLYALIMAMNRRNLATSGVGSVFSPILIAIIILVGITIIKQLFNGFQSYAINETIYFITPLFLAWIYVSNSNTKQVSDMLDILFYLCVLFFIPQIVSRLTLENLQSIDLSSSFSPFESGFAYFFLLFEWLYFFKKQKKKAVVSLVLCVIGFKRFCMLAAVLLLVFSKIVGDNRKIDKKLVNIAIACFVLLPGITCIAMNSGFENWFYEVFGVSLYKFTLSRSHRIVMLMESDEVKYGLGSTTVYLTKAFQEIHNSRVEQWNLHNDIVRIFMECGILGSVAFTTAFFKAGAFCRATFVLMIYIFLESYVNHLFGAGSVLLWVIIYLMLSYAKMSKETAENSIRGQ